MIIRTATIGDAEEIARVLKESYNIDSIEEGLEVYYSERRKGHHYIVAFDDDKVIGITTWLPHGLPKHMLAELDRIAVLPGHQGKGVARQLVETLKTEADSWYREKGFRLRKLYLLTHADNAKARKFYEKVGFTHETDLRRHYYDDKDECVYSVFLDGAK